MAGLNEVISCLAFGRRVATDIPLPGAIDCDNAQPPAIVVRRLSAMPDRSRADGDVVRDGDALDFTPKGVATYRCAAAGTIDVIPSCGADKEAVAALLIATALPGLLWIQGGFILHASAAVPPGQDRALAIVGHSGAGKSTLIADMVERGASLVADDSLCLRPDGNQIGASGLPGGYFAHHPDPAKRSFVRIARNNMLEEAPLGGILLLSRRPDSAHPALHRLRPLDALSAILSHRHRPAIPALFDSPTAHLAKAVRIARTPVFRWSRPEGLPRLTTAEWQTIVSLDGESGDG